MKKFSILYVFLLICSKIWCADVTSNLVYIVVDGIDRGLFYTMVQKGDLPNVSKVVARGNYRNLELKMAPANMDAYPALLTGYCDTLTYDNVKDPVDTIPAGMTVFDQLNAHVPSLNIGAVISESDDSLHGIQLSKLLASSLPKLMYVTPEKPRDTQEISSLSTAFLQCVNTPFFLFVQFTSAQAQAEKWGPTSPEYQASIREVDEAIGQMIATLTTLNRWDSTHIILTTNHGPSLAKESWIVSTFPIRYKGADIDIVPTIYRFYGINWRKISPELEGKALIY